jgi:hypothetical protein
MDIYVVMKDGPRQYYLLKVQRHCAQVVCTAPGAGTHFTRHSDHSPYLSHIRPDNIPSGACRESPVFFMGAEAGEILESGGSIQTVVKPLAGLDGSTGICNAIVSQINCLSDNFREFTKTGKQCFVIDRAWFPADAESVTIGVYAVPHRNQIGFQSDHPNLPPHLLFRVTTCEPQVWICAHT